MDDMKAPEDVSGEIEAQLHELTQEQTLLIRDAIVALRMPSSCRLNPNSDIASELFATDFENRLKLHHAFTGEPMSKKAFEYAFAGSSEAAGRTVVRNTSAVYPGEDIRVDGVAISLKTEASASISNASVHISKFMEARWLRDCSTPEDYVEAIKERIVPHLERYARIIDLRAFRVGVESFRYKLIEVPKSLLLRVGELGAGDVKKVSGGSVTIPVTVDGARAFSLRLDLSVEKVTLSAIKAADCVCHAEWDFDLKKI